MRRTDGERQCARKRSNWLTERVVILLLVQTPSPDIAYMRNGLPESVVDNRITSSSSVQECLSYVEHTIVSCDEKRNFYFTFFFCAFFLQVTSILCFLYFFFVLIFFHWFNCRGIISLKRKERKL